jgi:hypothetical protein
LAVQRYARGIEKLTHGFDLRRVDGRPSPPHSADSGHRSALASTL